MAWPPSPHSDVQNPIPIFPKHDLYDLYEKFNPQVKFITIVYLKISSFQLLGLSNSKVHWAVFQPRPLDFLRGFPTWDQVRTARPAAVQKAIRCGGLAPKPGHRNGKVGATASGFCQEDQMDPKHPQDASQGVTDMNMNWLNLVEMI